jgi:hypothetical protein
VFLALTFAAHDNPDNPAAGIVTVAVPPPSKTRNVSSIKSTSSRPFVKRHRAGAAGSQKPSRTVSAMKSTQSTEMDWSSS